MSRTTSPGSAMCCSSMRIPPPTMPRSLRSVGGRSTARTGGSRSPAAHHRSRGCTQARHGPPTGPRRLPSRQVHGVQRTRQGLVRGAANTSRKHEAPGRWPVAGGCSGEGVGGLSGERCADVRSMTVESVAGRFRCGWGSFGRGGSIRTARSALVVGARHVRELLGPGGLAAVAAVPRDPYAGRVMPGRCRDALGLARGPWTRSAVGVLSAPARPPPP
jgi:hypothetical protein